MKDMPIRIQLERLAETLVSSTGQGYSAEIRQIWFGMQPDSNLNINADGRNFNNSYENAATHSRKEIKLEHFTEIR